MKEINTLAELLDNHGEEILMEGFAVIVGGNPKQWQVWSLMSPFDQGYPEFNDRMGVGATFEEAVADAVKSMQAAVLT